MIDWHSHILPCMDDGSRSLEESLKLVRMLREQGIDTVMATPHFYANDESVEHFLQRRQNAYNTLICQLTENNIHNIRILPGAEVRYYPGIKGLSDLRQLCIGETNLLLLEMPFSKWTEYTVRELMQISNAHGVTVILAHIERYIALQSRDVWCKLYENGVLMQVNASFFTELLTKRKALNLLWEGGIHFIGSDCHDLHHRPPKIGKAVDMIRNKFGSDFVDQLSEYGYSRLAANTFNK